jgi:hypothetical protein
MLNFTYEDDIKIKNKHVEGISRTFYLSTETISRPPKSRETIPLGNDTLKNEFELFANVSLKPVSAFTKISL